MLHLLAILLLLAVSCTACNIPRVRIDESSEAIDIDNYDDAAGPTIYILPASRNAQMRRLVERDALLSAQYASTRVKLSSSNSYSHGLLEMPLHEYIRRIVDVPVDAAPPASISQTPNLNPNDPHTTPPANETFYMFGHNDGTEPWRGLSAHYLIPPCGPTCSEKGTKTLGIAGKHSGVSFHLHGPTFSEAIIGRKHWFVLPPDMQPDIERIANMTMVHWYRNIYPALPAAERARIWECAIGPGEIMYFPTRVLHATLNLDAYNVFMSLFV